VNCINLNKIVEKLSSIKENPLIIQGCYNLLYGFSLCQIQFNKIKNSIEPTIKLLTISVDKYLKDKGLLKELPIQTVILIDKNGRQINDTLILTNNDLKKYIEMKVNNLNVSNLNVNNLNVSNLILLDNNKHKGYVNYVIFDNLLEDVFGIDYKESNINFFNIELEHNNKTYNIILKDSTFNYYIVNNSLNQIFFEYYIKNVLKIDINVDFIDYKVTIIDQNVNVFTLLPNQSIRFYENEYTINQDNIYTDELRSEKPDIFNQDNISDNSDDFIKLETIE
jgi:hypothetical protein